MPLLNERELKKHISEGDFKPIYLIYGEEKYLVKLYTDMLTEKLVGKAPSEFSLHTFSFMNFDLQKLQAAVLMVPFMGGRKCVRIEDVNPDELNAADWRDLEKIIGNIPDTSSVIFTFPSQNLNSSKDTYFKKLAALADKQGICAELKKRTELSLQKDLVRWAEKLGSKLSTANAGKLIEYTTNDIVALQNELRKLAAYADGGEITLEMIDSMVAKNLQAKIFELSDSVIDGRADKAYQQLAILFSQKENKTELTSIVSMIGSAYIDAYRVKIANENGIPTGQLIKDFAYPKNREFLLKRAAQRASRMSLSALRECISEITETDTKLKSSSADKYTAVEKLIARLLLIAARDRGKAV